MALSRLSHTNFLAYSSFYCAVASNVKSFIILRSGQGLTSFSKKKRANFSGKKAEIKTFRGFYIFKEHVKSNIVLVVVLFVGSKGLE